MTLPRILLVALLMNGVISARLAGQSPAGTYPGTRVDSVLPASTGAYRTGRWSFHWTDAGREELETKAPGDKRELMVHLFYPADRADTGRRARYVPDADAMRGPWNDSQVERITALRSYARENATLPSGTARFPVLVFMPGGGIKALTYQVLLDDLASHGWVVAAIDPPYNAQAVRFPDGRVLGGLAPELRGWPQTSNREEEARYYTEKVVHWARDVSFVIDQLTALDQGTSPFSRRLDLARGVGVFGHSRGGQVAGTVRLLDDRVRGGINIDGTQGANSFQPVKGEDGGAVPFMWIQGTLPLPSAEQLEKMGRTRAWLDSVMTVNLASWHERLGRVSGGALRVYVDRPGITHMDFSDQPFVEGSLPEAALPGKLSTIADTRAWVRAFFDATVRGRWDGLSRLVSGAGRAGSEVTVTVFGKPGPGVPPQ